MSKPAKARTKARSHNAADPVVIKAAGPHKPGQATAFFRAPESFEALKVQLLSKYLNGWDETVPFRIWVPGCATGEEAYSIAIVVHEFLEKSKIRPKVQILATDVSEAAIQRARFGSYPKSITKDVSKPRLRRFFIRTENGYRVAQFVRDTCVFSRHFLTANTPFANIDLICCRNILVYFSADLQHRVVRILHKALKPNGILWLGADTCTDGDLLAMNEKLKAINDELNKRNSALERSATREKKARLAAERANRIKDEFLATVSHELRSPLTTILSWAQILRVGKKDKSKVMKALAVIETSAKAQGQLIDDLLDIARIQAGKMHLNLSTIDPAKCVSAALESIRAVADEKAITIELKVDHCPRKITADSDRVQQVLRNLLTNAVKFTPPRGKITVFLKRSEDVQPAMEIQVRDTGKGINPDFLPRIFTRFSQQDDSTRSHGGLGLGLSIVRHLVEMHGGWVMAESAGEDQGSTFTVTLPCGKPIKIRKR